jgi:serine phosphatase RsbU (regulator of sigma subunit)/anti-sigma regulatory factor (Ser/Thr protein kinase)
MLSTSNPAQKTASGVGFRLRVSLACDLEAVRPACLSAVKFLAVQRVHPDHLAACELALVEACNNAILYARQECRHLPVELELVCEPPQLELHVIDHTPGFNWPLELPLPEPDSEHGRGLFIIQSLMDDAFYLRGRSENRLIMRKQIRLAGPGCGERALIQTPVATSSGDATPRYEVEHKLALSEQVLNSMAQELGVQVVNARLAKEQLDNSVLGRELEIARNIQQSLLPRTFPSLQGFGLSGFCLSARQVGGDFFDVLPLSDQSVLLVVADVMGKGVPAALFAATLRTLVRTTVNWTRRPSELLRRINHHMFDELSGVDMFITAQLALVDLDKQSLAVANAGHCPLLLTNREGETISVSPEGMPLGIVPQLEFADQVLNLDRIHSVLLYTDGLTEARNPDGEWFGHERLLSWLRKAANSNHSARELSNTFLKELDSFQSSAPIKDDQTFLILAAENTGHHNTVREHISSPSPAASLR